MPISLPPTEVTWEILPCQQVLYTSVLQVCAESIFTVVKRLITKGWVVKGSCNGTTGAMDGLDRWNSFTDAQLRFSGVGGAQSWFVLTDADGADIVFSFNSALDDQYNFWFSPGGLVVINATDPEFEPTATDQIRVNAYYTNAVAGQNPTTVDQTVTAARRVSVWTRTDSRGFRVAIARSGSWASKFGKDRFAPADYGTGIVLHPGFGFHLTGNNVSTANGSRMIGNALNTPTAAGRDAQARYAARRTDSPATIEMAHTYRYTGGTGDSSFASPHDRTGTNGALQGGTTTFLRRYGLWSVTGGHDGDVGRKIDWYLARTGVTAGDVYGGNAWIVIDPSHGMIWPWDGVTTPIMS